MTLPTWYESDITDDIRGKRVAVVGYGAQGRAQALNLRESGARVCVGLRKDSPSLKQARDDGLETATIAEATGDAEWIAMLLPDETHGEVYREHIESSAAAGATLVFAHGYSIHYGLLEPRRDLDVVLAAPKGAGFQLRGTYRDGNGIPGLVAVEHNASGLALDRGLVYLKALGCARAGIMSTTFADETETDLFGEQVVLCGGVPELVREAFETLTDAGYPAELAYFECLHELKLICDLLHARGIAGMSNAISNTAEFGALVSGPKIVDDHVRRRMREVLADVQNGHFAEEFRKETKAGQPRLKSAREDEQRHPIETVGRRLRAMMPWLDSPSR